MSEHGNGEGFEHGKIIWVQPPYSIHDFYADKWYRAVPHGVGFYRTINDVGFPANFKLKKSIWIKGKDWVVSKTNPALDKALHDVMTYGTGTLKTSLIDFGEISPVSRAAWKHLRQGIMYSQGLQFIQTPRCQGKSWYEKWLSEAGSIKIREPMPLPTAYKQSIRRSEAGSIKPCPIKIRVPISYPGTDFERFERRLGARKRAAELFRKTQKDWDKHVENFTYAMIDTQEKKPMKPTALLNKSFHVKGDPKAIELVLTTLESLGYPRYSLQPKEHKEVQYIYVHGDGDIVRGGGALSAHKEINIDWMFAPEPKTVEFNGVNYDKAEFDARILALKPIK